MHRPWQQASPSSLSDEEFSGCCRCPGPVVCPPRRSPALGGCVAGLSVRTPLRPRVGSAPSLAASVQLWRSRLGRVTCSMANCLLLMKVRGAGLAGTGSGPPCEFRVIVKRGLGFGVNHRSHCAPTSVPAALLPRTGRGAGMGAFVSSSPSSPLLGQPCSSHACPGASPCGTCSPRPPGSHLPQGDLLWPLPLRELLQEAASHRQQPQSTPAPRERWGLPRPPLRAAVGRQAGHRVEGRDRGLRATGRGPSCGRGEGWSRGEFRAAAAHPPVTEVWPGLLEEPARRSPCRRHLLCPECMALVQSALHGPPALSPSPARW